MFFYIPWERFGGGRGGGGGSDSGGSGGGGGGEDVKLFPEAPVFGPEGATEAAEQVHDTVVIDGRSIDGL